MTRKKNRLLFSVTGIDDQGQWCGKKSWNAHYQIYWQVCKLYKVVNFDDTDTALSDGRMISIQCEELTQELTLNLRYDDDGKYKLQ